jgi:arabinogalactan endo-1,4-beta-galactosidase
MTEFRPDRQLNGESLHESDPPPANPRVVSGVADRRAFLRATLGVGAAAALPLLPACGGGGGGGETPVAADTVAPTLSGTEPVAQATSVDRSTAVTLRFNEPVRVADGAVALQGPQGPVAAALQLQDTAAGTVATLVPARPLGFGEQYIVTLGGGVRDAAGNALAPTQFGFTTRQRSTTLELGGIVIDTYVRRRWSSDPKAFNALPYLVDNGFEWLRVGVTTVSRPELRATTDWAALGWRNEYWCCLEVTGALMREAADLGMRLNAMLFLSDTAAHWGQQGRPPEWQGLDDIALAAAVEAHARGTALYFQSLGLDVEVWEIGNEIDAGAFGWLLWDTVSVPAGVDPLNDPAWMRANLWARIAPLLRAAIRGVRSVYPVAKICLHVAGFGYSRDEIAASAFFDSMVALDVPFDIAGLSFPYMAYDQGLTQPFFGAPGFLAGLDRIATHGRPIHIVEMGYNAKPEGTAVANPAYPYTPKGQADFIRDLALAIRGRVQRLIAFYPDYYDGMAPDTPELEGLGLFSAPGVPRPALAVFNDIAEGRILT